MGTGPTGLTGCLYPLGWTIILLFPSIPSQYYHLKSYPKIFLGSRLWISLPAISEAMWIPERVPYAFSGWTTDCKAGWGT